MDFLITDGELAALCGLPHIQQLAYLRGIRPYMDVKTGLVGIKRGISYQSIAEQLYVEPHQGIKSESCSRMQVRRALSALVRAGLVTAQSEGLKLILKCEMATTGYSVQNKVDLKPTQQAGLSRVSQVAGSVGQTDKKIKNNKLYIKYSWVFEKIKTKKGCDSYFEKRCNQAEP